MQSPTIPGDYEIVDSAISEGSTQSAAPVTTSALPRCLACASGNPCSGCLGWAAGFIDGEGCILMRWTEKTSTGSLAVQVTNTSLSSLARLELMFGGRTHRERHYGFGKPGTKKGAVRPIWRWAISGRVAVDCLTKMAPLMVAKRDQAMVGMGWKEDPRGTWLQLKRMHSIDGDAAIPATALGYVGSFSASELLR